MDFEKIADNIFKSVEARIAGATSPLLARITELESQLKAINVKGERGEKGDAGQDGESIKGEKGADGKDGKDGIGLAGAMIDRDGALQITLTNGEVKNLGPVVGKDGANGTNGVDGLGFETFEMEYFPETHEVSIKASAGGRTKSITYPAGGITGRGYWTEGAKAKKGEAWTSGGCLWIALKDTRNDPAIKSEDWFMAARKGRDGERGQKGADATPPQPIKLESVRG